MTDLTIADLLEDERLAHFRSTLIQREIDVQSIIIARTPMARLAWLIRTRFESLFFQ